MKSSAICFVLVNKRFCSGSATEAVLAAKVRLLVFHICWNSASHFSLFPRKNCIKAVHCMLDFGTWRLCRSHRYLVGLEVSNFVWALLYFLALCVRAAKVLASLCVCTGSSEPWQVAYGIST